MAVDLERVKYVPSDLSMSTVRGIVVKNIDDLTVEEPEEEHPIKWMTIIFLPFQFWWQTIILYIVCLKCFFGPMESVLPFLTCSPDVKNSTILTVLKISYQYTCDAVYVIDTFFYILHRQVADEAMKREHLPKSVFLIFIDILSLIPFFSLVVSTPLCKSTKFWPNILNFTEMLVIYRVAKYFSLNTSHNYFMLFFGYIIMFVLILNAVTCFMLLFTSHGLCDKCAKTVEWHYDWRAYKVKALANEKIYDLALYIYGCQYVFSLMVHYLIETVNARTFTEFVISVLFMLLGYVLAIFVVFPKLFAENILRMRLIYAFQPRVKRIIEETKRRSNSPSAHISVEKFYNLIWKKRDGITKMPKAIRNMPYCMRTDIMQDLFWPVFYHSPTLKTTSQPFRRWLCHLVSIKYKLPTERFFAGLHCYTDLYYIKSGVVQIISGDDSSAPMLSVHGGTVFGDISFFVPPMQRKVIVRCLTYCQVYTISRADILRALNHFPEDRRKVMRLVKDKLDHARQLYEIKKQLRGKDRPVDEGIVWLKRSWWKIAEVIRNWRKSGIRHQYTLPVEEEEYHCAKYIGQLVMCDEQKLQTKSMFVKAKFPFIFIPYSTLAFAWHRLVIVTIYFVMLIYPPNVLRQSIDEPVWFIYVGYVVDIIYAADVVVSLMTAEHSDEKFVDYIGTVMYQRIKKKVFILDLLSTFLFEKCIILLLGFQFAYLAPYNRLIKTYKVFHTPDKIYKMQDPLKHVLFVLLLSVVCYVYFWPYIMFNAITTTPLKTKVIVPYHYGYLCSDFFAKANLSNTTMCPLSYKHFGILEIAIGWLTQQINKESSLFCIHTLYDAVLVSLVSFFTIVFFLYHKMKIIAMLYLRNVQKFNYKSFVSTLRKHYIGMKIHPDLLKRLDLYLNSHWKYYHGSDILHPDLLKDEPYDVYWKLHGDIAGKIIAESRAFNGADPALIRALALHAKFLILPQESTLAVFASQTDKVTWIFRGFVKSIYYTAGGEITKVFTPKGNILSLSSVFLNRSCLRTYTAVSDLEILYLNQEEFNNIVKNYPEEWSYFLKCKEECLPIFEEVYAAHMQHLRDYKEKVQSYSETNINIDKDEIRAHKLSFIDRLSFIKEFRTDPESRIIRCWMAFRVFVLFGSLTLRPSFYMSRLTGRYILATYIYSSDCITAIDIIIKMFVPYYDERGLVISDIRKCVLHYMTRGFLTDISGLILGIIEVIDILIPVLDTPQRFLENTFPYLHLYLLIGFFDYCADKHSANTILFMVLKWVLVMIALSAAMIRLLFCLCVNVVSDNTIVGYSKIIITKQCWLANYFTIWERKPTAETFKIVIANCANAVLSFFLNLHIGYFQFTSFDYTIYIVAIRLFLMVFFWFVSCYYLALLILKYRGDCMFERGVSQLRCFLEEERIDQKLIERTLDYFSYLWKRTSGVNMKVLMNQRVAAIFRQDLNYYFFRRTLLATSKLLNSGEHLERKLAYYTSELCFLPGEDIAREMDLCNHIFIVHRGGVELSKDGKRVAVLTKGSIFGQLTENKIRPLQITAKSIQKADVLIILIKDFQQIIHEVERNAIANDPNSKNDYMKIKKAAYENPYNTIEYILRGNKAIRFPFMKTVIRAEHSIWYHRWLVLVLLVNPLVSTALAFLLIALPFNIIRATANSLIVTDLLHLIHVITEFFTMQLAVVERNKATECAYIYGTLAKFKNWRFYFDIISVFAPYLFYITNRNVVYGLARMLRVHAVLLYYRLFCNNFKTRIRSTVIKFAMFMLLIHASVCGFIFFSCRTYTAENFPVHLFPMSDNVTKTIDNTTWLPASKAKVPGCHVTSLYFDVTLNGGKTIHTNSFLVPKSRGADYLIALTYIIAILTTTDSDMFLPVTAEEIIYCIFMRIVLCLITIWISSYVISSAYTRYIDMYNFDFEVNKLLKFLKRNGVSNILRDSVKRYTKLLWYRTKGHWLPKITYQAPQCLREDILSALYMHHLLTPIVFQNLPDYFLRQLAVRLKRTVIFPGKTIVQEGDIKPSIYFIHEGEVERWYVDKNGDSRMSSVLTTNGYFGLIPGLFPKKPYEFSYCTRTVVDFVYLRYDSWQDLLNGYPDIKAEIYSAAKKLIKEIGTHAAVPMTTKMTRSYNKLETKRQKKKAEEDTLI